MPKFSVKKPYTVLVAIALVVVLGVVALSRMTTDLLPSMSMPYAIVMTTYPGASPEEVEEGVTKPIESAMATTSNIKNVSSVSSENYSMVILEFEQTANMDSVTIEMRESLDQITGYFPDSAGNPIIMKINPDMLPIVIAAADVDGLDRAGLSQYVESSLIPEIESIEGVASVTAVGSIEEHIQVTLDQDKIDAINEKIKSSLDQSFADAQAELDKAKKELESGRSELEQGQQTLAETVGSTQNELNNKRTELMLTESDLKLELTALKTLKPMLEEGIGTLTEWYEKWQQAGQMDEQLAELMKKAQELAKQLGLTDIEGYTLPELILKLNTRLAEVNAGIAQMETALAGIAEGKITLDAALKELNKSQILGAIQMGSATAQLDIGKQQMEEAENSFTEKKDSAYEAASLDNILTADMLKTILTAQNFSMPAGTITEGKEEYQVRVGDKVADMEELTQLVLMDMHMDGVEPIRLSDVANVELVDNSDEVYASINGNPGIILSIEKQTGYSTGEVTDKVQERFKSMEETEEGLHTTVLMDQGIYIDMIVDSVLQNMIVGGILAVLILLLFLKDIKPTLVIACSIPVSVIFAVVLMYFSGVTLNVISLAGLALGIGMLVDNSIVVIENIYRLRSMGEPIKKAAVEGAGQVAGAITASTLTTICVFAPIIFTEGITRQLFVDMGLTIAYSLLASLIIALTFVPMMASGVLKKASEKKHPLFDRMKEGYARLLGVLLRFKPLVFLGVLVLLVGSIFGALSNGTAFMSDMESPQMTVTVTPPKEAELADASALSEEIIARLSELDDIDTIGAMAGGQSLMSMGSGGNTISMYLILKDDPKLSNADLTREILSRTEDLDCEVSVDSSSMDMSMLSGSGISVRIKGRDLDKMQEIAKHIAALVESVEGTTEVSDGLEETTPQYKITVDKEKAAAYGMTVAQVFQLVYGELSGDSKATTISTDVKDYEVYISGKNAESITREDLKELTFTYTDQEGNEKEIPLKEIADFTEADGLKSINRDAQERYITVSATVDEDHNVGLVGREIQKALDKYDCPAWYTIEMTGEDETINEAIGQVLLMMLLAVIFVYLIMVAQFQSLLSPFIIMFTIPLAFTGGFLALFFTGMEVSIVALLGFVMLAGVIVNNGIVMVDYTNQLRKEGMSKREALLETGKTRLRPILMTALTTIIAMFTMALGLDSGSEMIQPMAVVVVGGMIYGTLLTLIVVPCIYDAFHREKRMVEEKI